MASPERSHPYIPDHEVLRKIGGGAYGEVWLARGVTGAMRAVKVVWREDFSDVRTFEREFEGILKYEPISRDHPALVNVLHVGRSPDGVSFYYYVMELGDDVHTGKDINPIEYEARTLRPDNQSGLRLDTELCIDVGLRLAEALEHLHSQGLAHRDVKPSNVIFIHGKAKLADIGLVAARDQRTFVGTEGFVPPEGPGSAQADIYSLGKVLYEIATGKDRLEFPELPDELPPDLERKRWLELNRIICDICEPRISKRKITTATDLVAALRTIQRGHRRRSRGLSIWFTTCVLLSFTAWASWQIIKDYPRFQKIEISQSSEKISTGMVRVVSSPDGAEVFSADGSFIGITPTVPLKASLNSEVQYLIRKQGYRQKWVSTKVTEDSIKEPAIVFAELMNFSPPVLGEKWDDHFGTSYLPKGEAHVSARYLRKNVWSNFLANTKRSSDLTEYIQIPQNGSSIESVLATESEILAFATWLQEGALREGFLTRDHQVIPQIDRSFDSSLTTQKARDNNLAPFRIVVKEYSYGSILLTTDPPGASAFINGISSGETHGVLPIPKLKPGSVELLLVLEGYKPLTVNTEMSEGERKELHLVLEKNEGVIFGQPWENGIGMKFTPIRNGLMASIWETRIRDYQVFIQATKRSSSRIPNFFQGPDHPIIYVSRQDAADFCEWLTLQERSADRIGLSHHYRLPTDEEWSLMAGLESEIGDNPSQRDTHKTMIFTWGQSWPPPNAVANFADSTAAELPGVSIERIVADYDDGYTRTAPVGSFSPNELGIYDICGNVQEWISNDFTSSPTSRLGIVRGGGWNSYLKENLVLGWRNPVPIKVKSSYYGFRIVLSRIEQPVDER